jgi:hypothetical protein
MQTDNTTFTESLADLVAVLIAEATTPAYIVTHLEPNGRSKAGARRKAYLFKCLNCKEITKKRSQARYCGDRCRKEAERKRVAAARFFRENQQKVLEFLEQEGQSLVEYCDRLS